MKVVGVSAETGQKVEIVIDNPEPEFFNFMKNFDMSDDGIKKIIDQLNMSSDLKSFIYKLSKVTINVGDFILKIGRKILDLVCNTYKQFPMSTFGAVFGAIVGTLISSIPILGQVLGPIVTPVLTALGLVGGLVLDFQDKMLEREIARKVAGFSPLVAA